MFSRETLKAWQEKNHPWLELSDVHKETTENVRVTVIPFYMGCRISQNTTVYWVCRHFFCPFMELWKQLIVIVIFYFVFCSGGIVFVWRIWENWPSSSGRGIGEFLVYQG